LADKRYVAESRVTPAQLIEEIRALPPVGRVPRREPSERTVWKKIRDLELKTRVTSRGGASRTTISRADADRVVESFRGLQFDDELLGFVIDPEIGSPDQPIGLTLPTAYSFAPIGRPRHDPGPAHELVVSAEELLEFFRLRNARDDLLKEHLRQSLRDRLPGCPETFAVVLHVSGGDLDSCLLAVVSRVIPAGSKGDLARESLRLQSLEHLRMKTIYRIATARNPRAYLEQAVRRFSRDVARVERKLRPLSEAPAGTRLEWDERLLTEEESSHAFQDERDPEVSDS
jgi:hypothetical protein